jgi:hypothetical protein
MYVCTTIDTIRTIVYRVNDIITSVVIRIMIMNYECSREIGRNNKIEDRGGLLTTQDLAIVTE